VLTLGLTGRIWICLQPQDGRKGIDGLAAVVTTHLARDPPAAPLTPAPAQRSPSPLVPRSDSDRWPALRATRPFAPASLTGYRTGTRARRKPTQ
jgi:hypothetical protein